MEFPGPDAVVLRGLLFGQGRCCVVLVHDVGHDLDRWREQAFWLAEHGFRVLAVDMPGHGASDGAPDLELWAAAVLAAVEFAVGSGSGLACLVGEGRGATAALAAASGAPHGLRATVLVSPEPDDRIAAFQDLREARVPKLILVGSEIAAAVQKAETFYRGAIGPCELVLLPVAEQGAALFAGDWAEQGREKMLAHLRRNTRLPG